MVTRQLGGGWGSVQRNKTMGRTKDLGGFEVRRTCSGVSHKRNAALRVFTRVGVICEGETVG